jgi:hypothetical protein
MVVDPRNVERLGEEQTEGNRTEKPVPLTPDEIVARQQAEPPEEGPTEEELKSQREEKRAEQLVEQLGGLREETRASQTLANLMADPEIRTLLEARQAGRRVKVTDDTSLPPEGKVPDVEFKDDELNSLDNAGLSRFLVKSMGKVLGGIVEERLQKALTPLQGELGEVRGHIRKQIGQKVKEDIERVKEAHTDFETFRPIMVGIATENPGLSTEEVYRIAKDRMSKGEGGGRELASERPSSTSARSTHKQAQAAEPRRGVQGFKAMMSEGMERADALLEGLPD